MATSDIERKFDVAVKLFVWFIAFLLNMALSIPGIVIALQYRNDNCITETSIYNVYLDRWLFFSSVFELICMFIALPYVFVRCSQQCMRATLFLCNLIFVVLITIGIYLLVMSDLVTCEHDTLWAISVVWVIITSAWIVSNILYILVSAVSRRYLVYQTTTIRRDDVYDEDFFRFGYPRSTV